MNHKKLGWVSNSNDPFKTQKPLCARPELGGLARAMTPPINFKKAF